MITSAIANMTLGWWDGTAWVQVEEDTELPISGGEDYQVALLGTDGRFITGGGQTDDCPTLARAGVVLDEREALEHHIESDPAGYGIISGVAISAPWDLTPRPVIESAGNAELETTAVGLLEQAGFETDRAVIFQVVEADLEGDGHRETLVVVEDTELTFDASSGVYSMIFGVSPAWDEPRLIVEAITTGDEIEMASINRIAALADLNGDGRMEVVVSRAAYESAGVGVYELTDDGFKFRIGAGCGA